MWDGTTGLKVKDVADLAQWRADDEARRASIPSAPDGYKSELLPDFKLPPDWTLNADDPLWKAGKEIAHKYGLPQQALSEFATEIIKLDVAKHAAIKEGLRQRDESLGAQRAMRVEGLNTWFKGLLGDQVGAQFATTLFTKDIIEGFEKMQRALTNQGVTSFVSSGREEGRKDGKPDNWETMSPVDKRTWQLQNPERASA